MWRFLGLGFLAVVAGAQAQPQGRGPSNWQFVGAQAGRPGAVVKGAPFSADLTTETSVVLQDGNRIRQTSTLRFYRDGEGRTRREQSLNSVGGLANNTNLPTVVFINDPVSGMNYAVNPSSHTASRSQGGGRGFGPEGGNRGNRGGPEAAGLGAGRRMRPGGQNVKAESLGRQTIEGVVAEGTRTTIVIPSGEMGNEQPIQTVTESWFSSDLQIPVLTKRTDPRTGETVTRYTNITRGEPPHSLFEVPADYKVSDAPLWNPRDGAGAKQ